MRLGFPGRAFGLPAATPDGEARLVRLRDLLVYLRTHAIRMYRLDARLALEYGALLASGAPEAVAAYERELEGLGALAASAGIRLSFHPHASAILNTPDEEQLLESVGCLVAMARFLDALGQSAEGSIVLHGGGVYGDAASAVERFCRHHARLPEAVRRRTCLENDQRAFGLSDALRIHERAGLPVVFDALHHDVLNPERLSAPEALAAALATWPAGVTPKVHYATPRSEARRGPAGALQAPTWTEHADYVNPFVFSAWLDAARPARDFDVMLEAKARDLALLRLRQDLQRFRPDVARMLR